MVYLTELDVLKVIEKLESRKGFIRSNVERGPPSFTDVWNRLIVERKTESPNPHSYKTMVFRMLKRAVSGGKVEKIGKRYTLTDVGRALIRLEDGGAMRIMGAFNADLLSSIVYTSGSLIRERGELDGDKLRRLMRKIGDVIEEEGVPAGTKLVLKVDKDKK